MTDRGAGATAYRIERVTESNLEDYRAVRLAMLLDAPRAFGSTYADTIVRDEAAWRARVETAPAWLAWDGDRPVGSVGMGWYDELAPDETSLIGMWVAAPARGSGLGEVLVTVVVEAARAEGRRRLLLDVAQENAPAKTLYERMGFVPTGRTWSNTAHGDGTDAIAEVEYALEL